MTGDEERVGHLAGWSRLHGGHRPAGAVRAWLAAIHPLAAWLAQRRVAPNTVTIAALGLAVLAAPVAYQGGAWTALAAVLVVGSAVADGLDGAVAVLAGRASRAGAVLDSVADRLAEAALGAALWAAGAPGWLAAGATGVGWLHEYLRARAGAVGVAGIGPVTVAERPTRVVAAVAGLLAAWPLGAVGPAIGAAVGGLLGLAGLAQLTAWLARALAKGSAQTLPEGAAAGGAAPGGAAARDAASGGADEIGDDLGGERHQG
ncbi:MAG TPA: CDP-alcohol phosphatidyltransferase family protein [Micromonosporaceae bacterium]|nr:CDP-alcohol phosphatidyltransferase family protein [Micromonosporaceae bacterium]